MKNWIKNNLIISGRLRPGYKKILLSFLIKKNEIIKNTEFLSKDSNITERIYCILNDIKNISICQNENCKNAVGWISFSKKYYRYCSLSCSSSDKKIQEKIKKTFLEKYGVEHISQSEIYKEKVKRTNLERYGNESIFKSKIIKEKVNQSHLKRYGVKRASMLDFAKEKTKKTNINKYGGISSMSSEGVKNKRKKSMIKKYGFEHATQSLQVKEKTKKTCLEKYNVEFVMQSHISNDIINKISDYNWLKNQNHHLRKSCNQISQELGVAPSTISRKFNNFNIEIKNLFSSIAEKEIIDFIKSKCSCDVIKNSRNIISPYELDIFISKRNLAIEFDGIFWHSYDRKETIKEKTKHLNKTILCNKNNIKLFHIFENEWNNKNFIWKSIILNSLNANGFKIGGRKCEIKNISYLESQNFLNENHLKGTLKSSINLALFYKNEIISLMTFGKSRFNKNIEFELLRFCNKINTTVYGSASKLFKYFINKYNPSSIISYADLRYSHGGLYKNIGMNYIKNSKPGYFYVKNGELYSRIKFQKHKLHKLLDNFDPSLTESQNMFNNKYRRIWDCGNMVFEWKK